MGNRIGGKRKVSFPFFCPTFFCQTFPSMNKECPMTSTTLARLLSPARLIFTILAAALLNGTAYSADDLKLWYDKPATNWEQQALPIGNGRLGAMIFGGVPEEHIQFNEESLWIGDEQDTGAYQNFGDLYVKFDHGPGSVTNYRRQLDISTGHHLVAYKVGGAQYIRSAFASFPCNVMVFTFIAERTTVPLSGSISLTDAHNGKVAVENDRITAKGSLAGYKYEGKRPYKLFLNYESQVRVHHEGGTVKADGQKIMFKDVKGLILLLDAGTDFVQNRVANWRDNSMTPHEVVTARLDNTYTDDIMLVLRGHRDDYRSLFDRVTLDLGGDPAKSALPTDQRLVNLKTAGPDHGLEALLFQYGRYLLISSSRPGGLPANLQGRWNQSNTPPWRSDYHTDINVQMNYWLADPANLGECFLPYADWLNSIRGVRSDETKAAFHTRGWTMHAENGIFGGSTWAMGRVGQRLVRPEPLGPLRLHRRQGVSPHQGLSDDEGNLRVLARSPEGAARRHARRAQRLLARARPARGRRVARPAAHLGRLHQHHRSGRRPGHRPGVSRHAGGQAGKAAWPEDRPLGPASGMDGRSRRPQGHAPPPLASGGRASRPADHASRRRPSWPRRPGFRSTPAAT